MRDYGRIDGTKLCASASVFINTNVSMQGDSQMRYSDGLNNRENNMASNMVASRVLTMRLLEANVKVGEIPCSGTKGGS